MPFSTSTAIGKLSVVVVLAVFVAVGVLTLSQNIRAHAAAAFTPGTISNMPTSFHETVGNDTYTWTLKQNASDTNTSVDSGTWDVQKNGTDLGTVDSNVTITQNGGVNSYNVSTTSTIPGVASVLSGSSTEQPSSNTSTSYESVFGQRAKDTTESTPSGTIPAYFIDDDAATTPPADGLILTTDRTLGPEMVQNMANLITTEQNAYDQAENSYQAQGDTGNSTLAMAGSPLVPLSFNQPARPAVLPLPVGVLVLAGAGLLLTTVGGIINSVCGHNACGKSSNAWAIAGGIMSALGTAALIISGASVSGWIIAARAQAAALSAAAPAVEAGIQMATGTAAAAAAETAIPAAVTQALPAVTIAA